MKDEFKKNGAQLFNPENTLHIAVHMQGTFYNPDAPRPSEERRQPSIDKTADHTASVIEKMHAGGIKTLWSIKENEGMNPDNMVLYRAEPRESDTVIRDSDCSAVNCDAAKNFIQSSGAKTLILTGGYASICVAETADEALKEGYRVLVVTDGLVDQYDEPDLQNIRDAGTRENRAVFVTSQDVIACLPEIKAPAPERSPAICIAEQGVTL